MGTDIKLVSSKTSLVVSTNFTSKEEINPRNFFSKHTEYIAISCIVDSSFMSQLTDWWFGCHQFYFPMTIGLLSSSQLTSYFAEGWPKTTNQLSSTHFSDLHRSKTRKSPSRGSQGSQGVPGVPGSGLSYEQGDSLGLWPSNPKKQVLAMTGREGRIQRIPDPADEVLWVFFG